MALLAIAALFVDVQGDLDRALVRRVIHQRFHQIQTCYEKALDAKPTLEGRVIVDFTVDASGKVTKAAATGLDDSLDRCVEQEFLQLAFPASVAAIVVRYPIELEQANDSHPADPDVDLNAIDHVIQNHGKQFRACYKGALKAKPDLEGKVSIDFTIEASGKVKSVKASGLDGDLDHCIEHEFTKLVFPKMAAPVTLKRPLMFKRN